MNIIIFGCGRVGTCILDLLLEQKHDITAIDVDEAVIERLASTKEVIAVCADATNFHILEEADVKEADVVIACTNLNDVNIDVCNMAKKLGAAHTIAQIRRPDYSIEDLEKLSKMFNIDYIYNPDIEAAAEIFKEIDPAEIIHRKHFRKPKVMIMGASREAIHLCRLLDKIDCEVKLLDKDIDKCKKVCELVPDSITVTCADGTEKTVLFEEGIDRTDAFVALTDFDEQNLLISVYAKKRGVPRVVTKIRHNDFNNLVDNLGLENLVAPKIIAAENVAGHIADIGRS